MARVPGDLPSTEQGVFLVHLARARKLLRDEQYDVARKELELAYLARPNDEDVLNLLSVIEFKRGYYNEAAQAARALIKENPGSPILHSNLGLILFKAGVLGEAEGELRKAIELQPDHVRSHLYLGLLYRMRGKLGLALEHLKFAGAKKVVAEIEESLKKSMREGGRATADAKSAGAPAITAPSILKLAAPVAAPPVSVARPSTRPTAAASVTREPSTAPTLAPIPAPIAPRAPVAPIAPAPPVAPVLSPATDDEPILAPPDLDETQRVRVPSVPPEPPAAAPAALRPVAAPVAPPVTDRVPAPEIPAAPFPEAEGDSAGLDDSLVAEPVLADGEDTAPTPAARVTASPPAEPAVSPAAAVASEAPQTPASMPVPSATESRPLFHVRPDGGLEIASRGVVFVRKGSVVWYSGKMRFAAEASFRGTRLEKILRADGRGYLYVHDPGRQAYRRELSGQSLYLEGSRILALDNGLSFRLEPIHDFRMNRRVDILKIFGRGSVILSVGGPLLAHEVSPEFPLNVSSRDLVAWTGDLVPSVLEDRFLEEVMMPDVGSAPKIRFEGEGTVLTEPPRPRRRASDVSRSTEADRR
jgi:uncharacterized protein (AIM24 family)